MAFSIARLTEELEITPEQAQQVIDLVRGTRDPFTYPEVDAWRRQCYHDPNPKRADTVMKAIDVVLGTYGVESINGVNGQDRYWAGCVAIYCNTGDTYASTVLYDAVRDKYLLTTMGDFVERYERRYQIT